MKNILVVGRHVFSMNKMTEYLENAGFYVQGVFSDVDAFKQMENRKYDVIVLGGSVEKSSKEKIRSYANCKVIDGLVDQKLLINQINEQIKDHS